jgi:hypothetical protein
MFHLGAVHVTAQSSGNPLAAVQVDVVLESAP